MTARAVIPATQPNGVTPRASNARPYNQRDNCNKILGSPGGVGTPRPRFCGDANFMGWFVGAAYMPPVAAARILRYNGKTARDAYMRPLQTCRKFAFFQLSLTFRLFVGRGLDPSLPFCDYRQIPRRGGSPRPTGQYKPSRGRGGACPARDIMATQKLRGLCQIFIKMCPRSGHSLSKLSTLHSKRAPRTRKKIPQLLP